MNNEILVQCQANVSIKNEFYNIMNFKKIICKKINKPYLFRPTYFNATLTIHLENLNVKTLPTLV